MKARLAFAFSAACLSATLLAAPGDTPPPMDAADGATLYRKTCQGCHMPDGRGAQGAGFYPALAGNPRLAASTYPVLVVLQGRHGMPPFGEWFSDAQVAAVVNHVRSSFGNRFSDAITLEDVRRMRASALPAQDRQPK
jgi:mono/diheme cytochrome c family protein